MNASKLILSLLSLVALCCFLTSCGGNTQGTGGISIEGRILTTGGTARANVGVTVLETGDSTTTDATGAFALTTNLLAEATLLLEDETIQTQVVLTDIPSSTSTVRVSIEVEEESNSGNISEVEIIENNSSSSSDNSDSTDDSSSGSSGPSGDDDDIDESDDDSDSSGSGNDSDDDGDSDDDSDDSDVFDDDSDDDFDDNSGQGSSDDDSDDDSDDNSSDDDDSDQNGNEQSCHEEDSEGVITQLTSQSVTVKNITYQITSETEIEDEEGDDITLSDLAVGDFVDVRGECQNGTLIAERIRIED